MRKIEMTVQIVRQYTQEIELPDDEYEDFIVGELDEFDLPEIDWVKMFDECRTGDVWEDTDYSICAENGETVVGWNY